MCVKKPQVDYIFQQAHFSLPHLWNFWKNLFLKTHENLVKLTKTNKTHKIIAKTHKSLVSTVASKNIIPVRLFTKIT
jgi:hypothetical protein